MSVFRRFGPFLALALLATAIGCSKDVTIGAIISESGGLTPYGRQVRRGLDLALEEINAAGGVNGGAVKLVYRDDQSLPDVGTRVVRELVDDEGARIIIGAVSSTVTLAIAPICEEQRVLLLSPTSSAPKITDAGSYIFRNYPSDVLEGTAMADFARGLGLRRVVIFALDNDFGSGLEEVFTSRFKSRSREVLESFKISTTGANDLDAMIARVHEMDPDGIYLVAYEKQMVAVLNKLHEAGVSAVVMATSSMTPGVLRQSGKAAELVIYPQPSFDVNSEEDAVKAFVGAYRAKYDSDPDIYAAHGYDALKLIWQAMHNTGRSRAEEVQRGLLALENYQGAAGRTAFDERGDVVRYPQLFVVRDGQPVLYETFEQDGGELPIHGQS